MNDDRVDKIAKELGAERITKVNVIPGVPPAIFPATKRSPKSDNKVVDYDPKTPPIPMPSPSKELE